ncbi:MAG: CHAT domain-containing protein, partial [Candidatus Eisenbacteria bacterium]|nr:CHAT domain-containing protein [Candidatus Latescibacterota bacterium]MBD3302849.1 CHAT domain-containing protein [Candidatus Eisenbacteria bacterium]
LGAPDFDETVAAPPNATGPEGTMTSDPPSTAMLFRGPRPDCAGLRSLRFPPLPGSLEEAEAVAELWRSYHEPASMPAPVRLLTGPAATETAVKRQAPGNRLLHIATHGYFLNGTCPSGFGGTRGIGLLVSDENAAEEDRSVREVENPLLLSGLVLAGGNRREATAPDQDDGILTAQEIAALDLSGVDWAVLSACETGVGEVLNGEGVLGLRRAFRVAGTRTLITSLWSVRDEETRRWMDAFYRGRLEGKRETIDALREADLTMLDERRRRGASTHPFYWGAFIASGDWR